MTGGLVGEASVQLQREAQGAGAGAGAYVASQSVTRSEAVLRLA